MATLEVHDGQGRVQRVAIERNQTVLFGSSPKCDIVLEGAGVLPFHGRVRWKSSRYKVDASPDAQFLMVNGVKLASASFRQGDEIEVGPCRIFMIHTDEDLPHDDKTRIQPAPAAAFEATPPPAAARPSPKKPRPRIESTDWMKDLEVIAPSVETELPASPAPHSPGEVLKRSWRHTPTLEEPKAAPAPKAASSPKARSGVLGRVLGRQVAPGDERILTSPLVFGLAVTLAVLVVVGLMLNAIIAQTIAGRLYQRAVENLEDGDYRNAIRRFDDYLARGTRDEKTVSQARVLRGIANVRQYASTTGASWSNALTAEREMFESVAREPAYRDSSTELAELILKTGEALADRARLTADPRVLTEAESALVLHREVAGSASAALVGRSRLPNKLDDARAAVRKATVRTQALAAMDKALAARSASGVYAARDALVDQYADLANDRELVGRMTKANDLIKSAVSFDSSHRPAITERAVEPLGPAVSLVLRATAPGRDAPAAADLPVMALADGFAYGLDAASGAPRWQVAVGPSAPFAPRAIAGGNTAIGFDARRNELMRIDRRTGAIAWRQPLGEAIADPPLVLGNQVIQTTPGGKVLLIDLPTGEVRGTFTLGLPLGRTPVSDESGQYLYVVADKDCLFILRRDPAACQAVEYLGHASGSLQAAPARLGRFLIVAENHDLADSRWRVFELDEDGARMRPVQQVAVSGWTWESPASAGSVVWATADRGGLAAFAAGAYEQKSPFRRIARLESDLTSSGPAFALARNERELWLSSGLPGRYDLDVAKGTLTRGWALVTAGPALAPIQMAGPLVVMTHQALDRPGVALWGLDARTGAVRWQTVLGAPWPTALRPAASDEGLTALGADGRPLAVSPALLDTGGFVESDIPGPGGFRLPEGLALRLDGDGPEVLVAGSKSRNLLVRQEDGAFRSVDLPVALGAAPLRWGPDVLIPGDDGRAYLIDPLTGESRAEPFVPTFDREHPTHWRAPVRLDGDAVALADEAGKVRRLTLSTASRPRLEATAETALGSALVLDPVSTGTAVVVATADGKVRSLAARDLSPVGAWPLDAPLAGAPAAIGGRAFVTDRAGGVHAFGTDGGRLWSATLRGADPIGPPVVQDDSVWFLARDGSLHRLALADGAPLDRLALDVLPAGPVSAAGSNLVIPAGRGTVQLLDHRRESGGKPPSRP